MSKILVTGGAGYIGSHTIVELISAGYTPIILDDFRNSKPFIFDRLEKITDTKILKYEYDCNDSTKVESVFEAHPDIIGVIHFAAYKAVGESVQFPLKYYQNNLNSLMVVMAAMEKFKIKHLVFSSSCTVYGEPDTPIVVESTEIKKANSPYGDTKIACEKIIDFTFNTSKFSNAILLRYFNPIGAHDSALIGELPQGIPNNLVPYITQTAKKIRKELTVFGDTYNTEDGTCVRDYIHVVDLAKAHVKAIQWLEKQAFGKVEAFNLGTGKGSSVLEIINTFEKVNNVNVNYKIGPKREGDVEQIYANPSKANSILNWQAEYNLEDALKHSWAWEQSL